MTTTPGFAATLAQFAPAARTKPAIASGRRSRGFTVVEIAVVLAIVGLTFALALPNMLVWLRNTQIRTAAETFNAGLSLARAEALRRNAAVEFVLTDSDTSPASTPSIIPSLSGQSWLVRLYHSDDQYSTADFIQARTGREGTPNVRVTSNTRRIVFNSLGDYALTDPPNTVPSVSLVSADGMCEVDGGSYRCLEVDVRPGGMIKMCDPRVDPADPRTCVFAS